MRLRDDAQRLAARQMPQLLGMRIEALEQLQPLLLPGAEIRLLRQPPQFAQPVEDFAFARMRSRARPRASPHRRT